MYGNGWYGGTGGGGASGTDKVQNRARQGAGGGLETQKYGQYWSSPGDYYNLARAQREGNKGGLYDRHVADWTPNAFRNWGPTEAGQAWLGSVMADPYGEPESMLTSRLAGTDRAFDTAGQRVRSDTLGSGAVESGVARGARGNVETARAATMAEDFATNQRERLQRGDNRLMQLLLPYMGLQGNVFSSALHGSRGQGQGDDGGNFFTDLLGAGLGAFGAYQGAKG